MLAERYELEEAWESFIEKDILDYQRLRPEVADSWKRCRDRRVNPFGDISSDIKGPELEERLKKGQLLLEAASPYLEILYSFVKDSNFQVVLADKKGILLHVLGDPDLMFRTRRIHLVPGGNWDEAAKGTNAIGMALIEKRSIQIFAQEHYCKSNHFLTCSATPIFDPEGNIIGVLDVSGDYRVANPHTLGMVVAAAKAIETNLILLKMQKDEEEIKPLRDIEKNTIIRALKIYRGNISKVSTELGIGRNTIYRKMKEYDINF